MDANELKAEIEKIVPTLAENKARVADLKQALNNMVEQVKNSPEYQQISALLFELETQTSGDEKILRGLAVDFYQETEDKHPHPAVSIRVNRELKYSEAQALDWCKTNLPAAVKLDNRSFEKYARSVADTVQPVPCVELVDVPSAAIATDLSMYILPSPEIKF